jgi:hypothetical protein
LSRLRGGIRNIILHSNILLITSTLLNWQVKSLI